MAALLAPLMLQGLHTPLLVLQQQLNSNQPVDRMKKEAVKSERVEFSRERLRIDVCKGILRSS